VKKRQGSGGGERRGVWKLKIRDFEVGDVIKSGLGEH
jgi:hypothetical protein